MSKRVNILELSSQLIASDVSNLSEKEILNALLAREKLGSTGIGHGFAIPHARLSNLKSPLASFVRLQNPIEYNSIDGEKVDMLFAFIVPEEQTQCHLDIVSSLTKRFSKSGFRQDICKAKVSADMHELLTETLATHG